MKLSYHPDTDSLHVDLSERVVLSNLTAQVERSVG